jgi:hypothetical protein
MVKGFVPFHLIPLTGWKKFGKIYYTLVERIKKRTFLNLGVHVEGRGG